MPVSDIELIKGTLRLARRAAGYTSPNPMVGALLVRNGTIISGDYHRAPGTPHAEALVIATAGSKANGAELYVNLEPCCHTMKRTPPCTRAIINAGIKRVVIAMEDPNPHVSGKGIRELLSAGITVEVGILEEEARRLNEAYMKYITTRTPFVLLKTAMSLDGKIALPTGESRWITGEKARRMVHRMRSSVDAILTAIGTVKADNPAFTARITGGRNPKRILIDPSLEIPDGYNLLSTPPETFIVTRARGRRVEELRKKGVQFISYRDKLDLKWLMQYIGGMGITSVMIEGGSSLAAHALEEGVVDKVAFFIAPKIIAGKDSFPAVGGTSCPSLKDAYSLRDLSVRRVGEDILIEGYVKD